MTDGLPQSHSNSVMNYAKVAVVGIFLIGLAIIYERELLADRHHEQELRLETVQELAVVRENIQSVIFDRILEMRELATIVERNPRISDAEFEPLVMDYIEANPDVINIALAPDLVVTSVFPREGNEAALGLDYRQNADQLPKVMQAIELGHGIVTGPVDLVQGGQGLILRQPIFLKSYGFTVSGKVEWGIISMVVDYDSFVSGLGLSELAADYDVVIREVGDEKYAQQIFFGDATVFDQDPARLMFDFPFGTWELAATTKGGWPLHRPSFTWSVLIELGVLFGLLAAMWWGARLIDARRSAQDTLQNAIEAMPDAFVMFDKDDRLVHWNTPYLELQSENKDILKVGVTYEEILKSGLAKGLYEDALGDEEAWLEEWRQQRKQPRYDSELQRADGRVFRVSDQVMPDGSTVGLRIDVTDMRDARVAAEAANRAKSDFMAVLSHELRTPLTVMLGMARLSKNLDRLPAAKSLIAGIEALPEEYQKELVESSNGIFSTVGDMMTKLENSGEHLLFLVNEILDFAKMEASGLTLDSETIDIADIIAIATDQIRPMAEQKNLEMIVEPENCTVHVDKKRVQQVLMNLLGNAVKFTPEGSITVSCTRSADAIDIHVTDTGFGMPADQVEKVFEPFHQVDASNKRGIGGTGLGLAISREITEAHGGTLTATSTEGEGSTFTLRLPLKGATEGTDTDAADLASAA